MHAPLRISSERDELDVPMIHRYLSEQSYWKRGVAIETVRKGIDNALCKALTAWAKHSGVDVDVA